MSDHACLYCSTPLPPGQGLTELLLCADCGAAQYEREACFHATMLDEDVWADKPEPELGDAL